MNLVAAARSGDLWAIQAKAYDPRYRIKRSDVDTFLSESARPEISFRLVFATTNEIGATAKRTPAEASPTSPGPSDPRCRQRFRGHQPRSTVDIAPAGAHASGGALFRWLAKRASGSPNDDAS
jgi:hypothetical protein